MKLHYYLGALALALVTSCVQEQYVVEDVTSAPDFEVTATLNGDAETRTQLGADGKKIIWSEGDAISVLNDGSHWKYNVKTGEEGQEFANFKYDPSVGEITGATGEGVDDNVFVAVYPYTPSTTFDATEGGYVVNTEIPVKQTYAVDSYGPNSSPMVAVNELKPAFVFKNVGSFLKMPIVCAEGENVTIMHATLESKKHKIAGATAVTVEGGVPTSVVATGESSIKITCGEEGIVLDPVNPTNFIFVLAPGTYEADDLTLKFTDSLGSYFETKIGAENTFERSKGVAFKTRTFEATGVDPVDLWVEALAGVFMEAERIVPSITSITKVYNWVVALKDDPNTESLIQEAITLITLGKLDLAYDVLGGIPGLERQFEHFDAVGRAIVKVDITGTAFFQTMLTELEGVKDAATLLAFLKEFETRYEATGLKMDVEEGFLNLGHYLKNPEEFWNTILGRETVEKSEEELIAEYKAAVKSELKTQIDLGNLAIKAIDAYKSLSIINKNKYDSHRAEIANFVTAAQPLYDNIDNLSQEAISNQVNALPEVHVELTTLNKALEGLNKIDIAGIIPDNLVVAVDFDPKAFITGADNNLSDKLQAITNNGYINGMIDATIDEIVNYSLVDALEIALNSSVEGSVTWDDFVSLFNFTDEEVRENASETIKAKLTKMAVNALFSNPEFMQYVIDSIRELLVAYEESALKAAIDKNMTARDLGIQTAFYEAVTYAREDGIHKVDAQLDATNEKNLTSGPWGMFKKVLNNQKCVTIFTELGMLKVYTAITDLVAIIDDMITYTRTDPQFYKDYDDYEEGYDWWVLSFIDNYDDVYEVE